jgi:quercetin dioxygenase-like cupin family protein
MPDKIQIYHESDYTDHKLVPGSKVRFVHSENMTLTDWFFEPDILLPEHTHPHEQITKITSGEFDLYIEGECYHLTAGSTAVIPPNKKHYGKSLTECHIIDVFYPVREDYKI